MRKVTLWKGASLWEAGDTARTIAVLEKGTLGIRVGDELVGVASGRTVLGESAIFHLRGQELKRTAETAVKAQLSSTPSVRSTSGAGMGRSPRLAAGPQRTRRCP